MADFYYDKLRAVTKRIDALGKEFDELSTLISTLRHEKQELLADFKSQNDCPCKLNSYQGYCSCLCHRIYVMHSEIEAVMAKALAPKEETPVESTDIRMVTPE